MRSKIIQRLLLTCSIVTIAACTSVEPIQENPWTEVPRASEQAVWPITPPTVADDGSNLGAALEAALANYDIALSNAQQLEIVARAYNKALDSGELQYERTEQYRMMLDEERKWRVREKYSLWAIIAALGALGAIY